MFSFLKRRKKEKKGPLVYLSEPVLLYHTRTEKAILEIIEEKLSSTNVIIPSDYGIKDTSHMIEDAECFVAVAILGKFSSLVCREVRKAQELGKKIYTLDIVKRSSDELIYYFEEGIPEHIEWLSEEETREFFDGFLAEEFMGMAFRGMFIGYRGNKW
ncbi:hypothetical protein PFDSM3638_06600 [Pyrococcus furiosus DSM 3638]|nr:MULTISPECIES: hypothetical protein [Pyrococcus]AFN04104.1 hypothetical protein PFC_05835 [Pyrococcus furiosus COM1]MDK2870209.1 hypothetical protein [Pyrococcus sp.]QEK78960.1 hypothetical protein PFDSM3638_06600 [Pyrococcus furiosus DSM 3638]